MPLTPEQDVLCQRLEQQGSPERLAVAALIRQQASEIDSLWDRLNHSYMAMYENIGTHSHLRQEVEQLQSLAHSRSCPHSFTDAEPGT
jgi:hypothetical protein